MAGLGDPPVGIAAGRGRFGSALEMTLENTHVVLYKAERNVAYAPDAFRGTVSFWMSLDPAEIPGQYCDPLQITDKKYSDACIWVDFTKNDTPSDFRLGVFGDASEWDPDKKEGGGERFFWRLAKVAEPPFAKGRWTHVVVTWDGLNDTQNGRARLYFDGEYQGLDGPDRRAVHLGRRQRLHQAGHRAVRRPVRRSRLLQPGADAGRDSAAQRPGRRRRGPALDVTLAERRCERSPGTCALRQGTMAVI